MHRRLSLQSTSRLLLLIVVPPAGFWDACCVCQNLRCIVGFQWYLNVSDGWVISGKILNQLLVPSVKALKTF